MFSFQDVTTKRKWSVNPLLKKAIKLFLGQRQILTLPINSLNFWTSVKLLLTCLVLNLIVKEVHAEFIFLPLDGSSKHKYSSPYDGYFTALDGQNFNVSQFYLSQKSELNISGIAILTVPDRFSLKFPWYFDYGFTSTLYNAEPVIQVGLQFVKNINNSSFELGLTNLLQIGGKISERPCVDHLSREFHCGSGLPWVDRKAPSQNDQKKLTFTYRYRF